MSGLLGVDDFLAAKIFRGVLLLQLEYSGRRGQ